MSCSTWYLLKYRNQIGLTFSFSDMKRKCNIFNSTSSLSLLLNVISRKDKLGLNRNITHKIILDSMWYCLSINCTLSITKSRVMTKICFRRCYNEVDNRSVCGALATNKNFRRCKLQSWHLSSIGRFSTSLVSSKIYCITTFIKKECAYALSQGICSYRHLIVRCLCLKIPILLLY